MTVLFRVTSRPKSTFRFWCPLHFYVLLYLGMISQTPALLNLFGIMLYLHSFIAFCLSFTRVIGLLFNGNAKHFYSMDIYGCHNAVQTCKYLKKNTSADSSLIDFLSLPKFPTINPHSKFNKRTLIQKSHNFTSYDCAAQAHPYDAPRQCTRGQWTCFLAETIPTQVAVMSVSVLTSVVASRSGLGMKFCSNPG